MSAQPGAGERKAERVWVVVNVRGWPLVWTVSHTRKGAIFAYDRNLGEGRYRYAARRGSARAIRYALTPEAP